jgi:hypothetical protein
VDQYVITLQIVLDRETVLNVMVDIPRMVMGSVMPAVLVPVVLMINVMEIKPIVVNVVITCVVHRMFVVLPVSIMPVVMETATVV